MNNVKLPPLPGWCEPQSPIADILHDYARAAVALNAPKWQPIETAPKSVPKSKSSTPKILLANEFVVGIGFWDPDVFARIPKPRWSTSNADLGRRTYYLKNPPIAWMPLPSLPAGPEAA